MYFVFAEADDAGVVLVFGSVAGVAWELFFCFFGGKEGVVFGLLLFSMILCIAQIFFGCCYLSVERSVCYYYYYHYCYYQRQQQQQ